MRKLLSMLLVSSMLLIPVPVLAAETSPNVTTLEFDKLEQELTAHNPTIDYINEGVADGSSTLSDGIDGLEAAKTKDFGFGSLVARRDTLKNALITKGYLVGTPPTIPSATQIVSAPSMDDYNKLLDYINYQTYLNYENQIASVDLQIKGLKDQQDDFWKSALQAEMQKKQIIAGAQQLYLSYHTLSRQKEELLLSRSVLENKLRISNIKYTLGLIAQSDIKTTELDLKNINQSLKTLDEGLDSLKGEFNLMFGQAYDTALAIKAVPNFEQTKLDAMDYEDDLKDALVQSYNVRLQDEDNKRDDEKRKFTKAFHQAYQAVKDKEAALELERAKLDNERETYDRLALMYNLGMISKFNWDSAQVPYRSQMQKVENAEQDLFKAYTDYDWMKKGLTVSSSSNAAASSGAPGQ